uniref:Podocalyxin n=1 Tax=Sus scrofa TaxID=9823 RepID=A0A8D2A633_PIG
MRSVLVLSGLLLLLSPSFFLDAANTTANTIASTTVSAVSNTFSTASIQTMSLNSTSITTSRSSLQSSTEPKGSMPTSSSASGVTSAQQNTSPAASTKTEKPTSGSSPTVGSEDLKSTALTVSTKPEITSGQSEITKVTASVVSTEGHQTTTSPINLNNTSKTSPASTPVPALASISQPGTVPGTPPVPVTLVPMTPEPPGSSSQGSNRNIATTSVSTPATFTTQEMLITITPPVTSRGTQRIPSEPPVLPDTPTAPQPTGSASGPRTAPPARGPTRSSPRLVSAASPTASLPPPASASGVEIQCGAPERLSEETFVLNFSKADLCKSSPVGAKLYTLLCQAAKATFNPSQDQCNIQLAPVPEIQSVAVKSITIHTKLCPKDTFELLKNKWADLKEVGVTNMQLGDQGPPEETEDRFSMPLIITIVCMASFLLLVAALYGCCHQRLSQRKDQQRLTEELQTVENGYHDNPTLEVMETSSEMQEKKVANLNGELGDSWIVPLDNLTKDDLEEEEDTHL